MKTLAGIVFALASASVCAQPVPAGSAVIERAVTQLVPAPLQATIDARIPEDTVLRWSASSDWMRALQEATRTAGLRLQPNFAAGRIDVLPGATKTAPAAPIAPAVGAKASGSSAVASAVPAPAALTPVVVASAFVLKPGIRIDTQLVEWAKREGWSLIWTSGKSWFLPGTSTVSYAGPVDAAVEQAVRDLYGNGIPVRLDIWEANKVMEVSHAK